MKFSQRRLYVEYYVKCANCGVLIYDGSPEAETKTVVEDKILCSEWCADWMAARNARSATAHASEASDAA